MDLLYQDTSLVSQNEILKEAERLTSYIKHLQNVASENDYSFDESSINLPFDEDLLQEVLQLKIEKVTDKLKYVIEIGIGGSNLGTKAIYDALHGYFDVIEPNRFPKMIFADTNEPEFLTRLQKFLREEIDGHGQVLINAISKSGITPETIVNLEILEKTIPGLKNRLILTTGPDSELAKLARKQGLSCLYIPEKVGGRFSFFSAVGLFPLAAIGVDMKELLKGAREIREECLKEDVFGNPALLSAIISYLHFKNGKAINDNFFFHPEMESVGKWYRQLMGESIGKEKDRDGKIVNTGITPTVSIGSTDLHSMAQLYLGGPKDKFTTFVWGEHKMDEAIISFNTLFTGIAEGIEGKTSTEVMRAIFKGVKAAYKNKELPFVEIIVSDLTARPLGEFLQFKMCEMMFLGKLLNVNTFDQPAVDLYKKEVRKILAKVSP